MSCELAPFDPGDPFAPFALLDPIDPNELPPKKWTGMRGAGTTSLHHEHSRKKETGLRSKVQRGSRRNVYQRSTLRSGGGSRSGHLPAHAPPLGQGTQSQRQADAANARSVAGSIAFGPGRAAELAQSVRDFKKNAG